MALAGILRILVQGDTAQLQTDLQQAQLAAQRLGENMRGAFDAAGTALAKFSGGLTDLPTLLLGAGLGLAFKQVLNFADALGDTAERLGVTTTALQALEAQFTEAGGTSQQFERGLQHFNVLLGEAASGSEQAREKFRALGVAWEDTNKRTRTVESAFRDVMDALGTKYPEAADRAARAAEMFGAKAGGAFAAGFKEGSAAMDEFEKNAVSMGRVLDEQTIQRLGKLNDNMDRMGTSLKVLAANLLENLTPAFEKILGFIDRAITAFSGLFGVLLAGGDNSVAAWNKVADIQGQISTLEKTGDLWGQLPDLRKKYDEAVALARAIDAVAEAKAKADKIGREGAPAGPIAGPAYKPGPSEASKAAEAAARAEQRMQDEANDARTKYYQDEEKKRQELSDERVRLAGETARQELSFEEEVNRIKTQYILDEEKKREEAAQARVDAAFAAAQAELKVQEEANKYTEDYLRTDAARREREMEERLAPIRSLFDSIGEAFERSITGVIQGTKKVDDAFKDMGQSILLTISETIIKRGLAALANALINTLGNALGGAGGGGYGAILSSLLSGAKTAEGGIVTGPQVRLVGEAGPEAIIPLDRLEGGGGPAVTVNIIDQRKSGNVEQKESTGANGQPQVDVLITDVVNGGLKGGVFDQALAGTFGLSRRGVSR